MLFRKKTGMEILNLPVQTLPIPSVREAQLVHVTGSGQLSARRWKCEDRYDDYRYLTQMTLNGTPLVQINAPCCPTCSSLLATGYGLERADCSELARLREALNSSFTTLDDAINRIAPLLTLCESGLYLVADALCYPTDGDGRFFWNVPNAPTENPATAGRLLVESDCAYVDGQPVFLYPTQNTDCYNAQRVEHYINCFRKDANPPRAIVYQFSEFLSFLLDGHHKACASALMGRPLNCILIIPFTGHEYHQQGRRMIPDKLRFASISIPVTDVPERYLPPVPCVGDNTYPNGSAVLTEGSIIHRQWEKEYLDSAAKYPSVYDYADMIAADISGFETLGDDMIASALDHLNEENQRKLQAMLFLMETQDDPRLKPTALACANKRLSHCPLRTQAYRALSYRKNDAEIEQLFVDYLVDHSDPHDPLRSIIDAYWDK